MELLQLQYFVTVAKLEHMTRAAEQIHVSQSVLSKAIIRLEHELGVKLFDRKGKHIFLNHYGEIVLKYAEQMQWLGQEMQDNIMEERCGSRGELRLSSNMPASFSNVLNEIIKELIITQPNVKITHYHLQPARSQAALLNRDIDIAFTDASIVCPEIQFEEFFTEQLGLLIATDHPLACRRAVSLKNFSNERFLCMDTNVDLAVLTQEFCRKAGFEAYIPYLGDSDDLVGEVISQGKGVAFLSRSAYEWHFRQKKQPWCKKLKFQPLAEDYCQRSFGMAIVADRYVSTLEKKLIDSIRQRIGQAANSL